MSKFAIRAEGLGKKFRLGERERYKALRDTLTWAAAAPFRALPRLVSGQSPFRRPQREEFGALTDVCFEIAQGEVVGLIGRNGAGKSTLLKILSRIVEPTTGRALFRGRVGSLLEVGAGFHPELTGRENIYLNGAILGMERREVQRKFDEIVGFAEVEQFIDTPVKQYSSGMYMRLAFAVAAQLEPEILLVDEVLAVGDSNFQKKCIGRMGEVGREGRMDGRVPLTQHDCHHPALPAGNPPQSRPRDRRRAGGRGHRRLAAVRPRHYVAHRTWPDPATAPGDRVVRFRSVSVIAHDGVSRAAVDIRYPAVLEMVYDELQPDHVPVPNLQLYNEESICVFINGDTDPEWHRQSKQVGRHVSRVTMPGNFLSEGTLILDAAISTLDPVTVHVYEPEAIAFQVIDGIDGDSLRSDYGAAVPGVVRPHLQWRTVTETGPTPPAEGIP